MLEDTFPFNFLLSHGWHLVDLFDFCHEDLFEPEIFGGEVKSIQKLFLLRSCDELTVNESIECFYIGWIFLNAFNVLFDCLSFILLGFVALGSDEGLAAFHFAIDIGVVKLHF